MEKEAKEALFQELYQLDEDSNEEERCNASVKLRESRPPLSGPDVSARSPKNKIIHSSRRERSLLRTVSAPLLQPTASSPRQANVVGKSSFTSTASSKSSEQVVIDTPLVVKRKAMMNAQNDAPKAAKKRKRGQSLEMKSESQQIFKGLAFCGF